MATGCVIENNGEGPSVHKDDGGYPKCSDSHKMGSPVHNGNGGRECGEPVNCNMLGGPLFVVPGTGL